MKKFQIPILVTVACVVMGLIDSVIQPGYVLKSLIKIILFLLIPTAYGIFNTEINIKKLLTPSRKGLATSLTLGLMVYVVIMGTYLVFRHVFDFSALAGVLDKTMGVNKSNFLWVAIYIFFVNSFLEEFFFRGFSFIVLKKLASKRFAYVFSSLMFSLYHVAMMIGWFGVPVVLISILGLFVGGLVFNRFDEKSENIYLSWLIHMFANFATNTIGFILLAN